MTSRDQGYDVILRVLENYEVHDALSIADSVMDYLDDEDLMIVGTNEKKLGSWEVRQIRAEHKRGESQVDIAGTYGVNPATVSRIVRGLYH